MNMNRAPGTFMALALLAALSMGLSSCARCPIAMDRPQDTAMEAASGSRDVSILQVWSGDYPVAELSRLPAGQADEPAGYIGDRATFASVWEVMSPSLPLPEVDFTTNMVVFHRNTVFYNRTAIMRAVLTDRTLEILARETLSAMPIEEKIAMSLAVIPRSGVKFMQAGSRLIPVTKDSATSPLDAVFSIGGRSIRLCNGRADEQRADGSMTKDAFSVFGSPASGDLDGDGDEDAGLILVHDPGGSGTFFYVAACLNTDGLYTSTNAVLIGDRIAPQGIAIRNGLMVATYAERGPGEPMTALPGVTRTTYLWVKGMTLEIIEP